MAPSRAPLRCALLSVSSTGWLTDMLFCVPELELVTFSGERLGVPTQNPYGLPLAEHADVAIVDTNWFKWLRATADERLEDTLGHVGAMARGVAGLEGYDTFSLGMPPEGLDHVSVLLKAQGLYRDRCLYNAAVGPYFPGGNWHEPRHPLPVTYSDEQLSKLRMSMPCFAGVARQVRRRVRWIKPNIDRRRAMLRTLGEPVIEGVASLGRFLPRTGIHFVGSLTQIDRMRALPILAGLPGHRAVVAVPPNVFGTEHGEDELPPAVLDELRREVGVDATSPRGRARFLWELARHRVTFAPAGYGELTFRHGEALAVSSTLLCQDLSHVDTMFPFRDGENAVFCRPDLDDLRAKADDLLADPERAARIARRGHREWRAWVRRMPALLRAGLLEPLVEAFDVGT